MRPKSILVTGGAGYIGSHMLLTLSRAGFKTIAFDNLSSGHRIPMFTGDTVIGDIQNEALLSDLFSRHHFDAVMHFAASIEVGESVMHPEHYYENNVVATLQLLKTMRAHRVCHLIFSSSAAIYGEPIYTPLDEKHPCQPLNPYGRSKYMIEQMLADFAKAYDFHYIALRYFNAAGADPSGLLCEQHTPETHLIPLALQAAKTGQPLTVYGCDYPTSDGTCLRDYIHVNDLCDAHLLALEAVWQQKTSGCYNLGSGQGYSVQEVIDTARLITGLPIPVTYATRRPGDPTRLVANADLAKEQLGWQPRYSDLPTIIKHAWAARAPLDSLLSI